ncbi:MAG TPA: aspartate-semialdehyde dehydrogenase [Candidatus Limnocylindrales bacterium]|nr:aspartate-semialdehyde dehydrogenase [Candidatus Limnocylindrales bacterium]
MKAKSHSKIEVGVLGATGAVGQQFVALLACHPWFHLKWLAASERSAGKTYGELPWRLPAPLREDFARLKVENLKPGAGPKLVFSALDAAVAGEAETGFAAAGHVVVSNSRNHRMDPLVPLLIPEVNADHLNLLPLQKKEKKWRGAIVTNPNCSTVFLAMALAALRGFELKRVLVTTLQALSGAGYPGVASLDATANVIPYIDGEEEKIEAETRKILGRFAAGAVELHPVAISATTTRVPVVNGHTESVAVELGKKPERKEILAAFRKFSGEPQKLKLPSAPEQPIVYLDAPDRPQPRLDVDRGAGMVVHVGRLRYCKVLDYKFVLLGHNTIRGAAGAALLNAELLAARKLLD